MTFSYVDSINKLRLFNIAINQDFQADPTPNQSFVIYEGPLRNVSKHVVAQTFLLILIFPLLNGEQIVIPFGKFRSNWSVSEFELFDNLDSLSIFYSNRSKRKFQKNIFKS